MYMQECVYGLSCCRSGHDIDTARYYYATLVCVAARRWPLACICKEAAAPKLNKTSMHAIGAYFFCNMQTKPKRACLAFDHSDSDSGVWFN